MAKLLEIHAQNPQNRLLKQVVDELNAYKPQARFFLISERHYCPALHTRQYETSHASLK
jgi:hypothetical protein